MHFDGDNKLTHDIAELHKNLFCNMYINYIVTTKDEWENMKSSCTVVQCNEAISTHLFGIVNFIDNK